MLPPLLIGTYTEPILFGTGELFQGKGCGVYLCDRTGAGLRTLDIVPCANPSFLCFDKDRETIYAVNEMKTFGGEFGGGLSRISCRKEPRLLQQEATGGTDPCHLGLSPDRNLLCVSNFASGSLSAFSIGPDGEIRKRSLFPHEGFSVDPVRQKGPHAHAVLFMKSMPFLFVPDLGIDTVKAYRLEGCSVVPAPELDVSVAPGSGPRSGVFSRDEKCFYLICELSSQVMVFACESGRMSWMQTVDTLPQDAGSCANICSDLHLTPDGRYLFASNRGHDSICSFRVRGDGTLETLSWSFCGGRTPRNFAVDPEGETLLVGNQDSDNIAFFAIEKDGTLSHLNSVPFPSPVCIRFT